MSLDILLDPYIFSIIIFVIVLAGFVYKDRKKFERQAIILLRRTQRGKDSIVKFGSVFPRFWKIVGTLGAVIGFIGSVFIIIQLVEILGRNIGRIVSGEQALTSLAFVLPTPTQNPVSTTGLFLVPFWYWIIAIALLVVVHEGMHGILAASEKIKLKSLGWGLLLVIPLAFVEPDEKDLEKRGFWTQVRIFAGGSFANFLLAGLSVLIMTFAFSGMFVSSGVAYQGLDKGYPADLANITGYITEINGQDVKSIEDLQSVMSSVLPGNEIRIKTIEANYRLLPLVVTSSKIIDVNSYLIPNDGKESEFIIKTVENPNNSGKAYIGIRDIVEVNKYRLGLEGYAGIIEFFGGLLFFLFLINFGVGLANLLPIKPLDGGRMWEALFQKISMKHSRRLTLGISYITFLLLIINFALPFF